MAAGSALVLGGGGVTGIAWTVGLLHGLAEHGVDLTDADVVVGTSAGAAVGAQITTGRSLAELFALQCGDDHAELTPTFDLEALLPIFRDLQETITRSDPHRRARIGAMAMAATTVPEADRRAVIEARLGTDAWPAGRRLRVTAVDAESGELVVFDGSDGTGLIDAVAASCAVPGVWPPVTIAGRRYIDGGVRSVANADLAAGCRPVLLVAPLSADGGRDLADELARLGPEASPLLVQADDRAREAMGVNPLDPALRRPAAEAGRRQAAELAASVRAAWTQPAAVSGSGTESAGA